MLKEEISKMKQYSTLSPGDTLLRQALEGFTEMYFGKIEVEW